MDFLHLPRIRGNLASAGSDAENRQHRQLDRKLCLPLGQLSCSLYPQLDLSLFYRDEVPSMDCVDEWSPADCYIRGLFLLLRLVLEEQQAIATASIGHRGRGV